MSALVESPTLSRFAHLPAFAGDPILSLNQRYQQDPRAERVNLTIGIYFDEGGRVPFLDSVREAEARVVAARSPRPYLPIEGAPDFRAAVQELLFGAESEAVRARRIATIQTIGSSGGLTLGAGLLRRFFPESAIWVSAPTWENHRALFDAAGVPMGEYPYFDAATGGVAFAAMLDALRTAPPRTAVLLHACCHNPTGVDLSPAQWDELVTVVRERDLIPFLDLAYQGFADGMEGDAYAIRAFTTAGVAFLVANSFSKNMNLYGERCGALSVVCENADDATRVLGQLGFGARRTYSNPPTHGCRIATTVLRDEALRAAWLLEVRAMRDRMVQMRTALHEALVTRAPHVDFGYLLRQRGMFSFTGLSRAQVVRLREEHALYMLENGRLCVAGLNTGNVERAAAAIAAVV